MSCNNGDGYTAWTIVYGAVERKIEQLKMVDLDMTRRRLATAYKYLRFLHYVASKRDTFFDEHRDPLRPLEGFESVEDESEDARWEDLAGRSYEEDVSKWEGRSDEDGEEGDSGSGSETDSYQDDAEVDAVAEMGEVLL